MEVLWAHAAPMTAVQILELVPGKRPAHTTLLTALDRLCRKGLAVRTDVGSRELRFQPATTEAEHASQVMLKTLGDTHDRSAALLQFAGDLTAGDIALLRGAIKGRGKTRRAEE